MEKMYKQMPAQVHADRCGASKGAALAGIVPLMGHGEGLPAPLIYRKGWALLGYLALEPNRMHSRASLAALFWPNLGETSALTNLRQVLSNLNRYCTQQFGPEVLQIQRGSVGLLRGERILFDVDVLVQAPCDAIHLLSDQRIFLDGMEDIADLEFQAWLQTTRQMLEVQLISSVERCCDQMIERARWDSAIDLANALSRRDPWNEAHVQRAMRAHAGNGSSCEALTAYQRLEAFLRSDLGLDPCQETRRLLQQISALGSVVRAAPVQLSATI
ncbi:BTAD domain-containing putative transcriptional regulator [Stenotrophomonas sp.]|uniref:AfsR/SARP family transcriptional regulator n=1 Tax=Stenotrophomonas sp. TaxID=69392 RepID=UPI0028A9426F|nr:BTAD domain-containing putative transcriptional regulator [Stenotrophomonas sp.]